MVIKNFQAISDKDDVIILNRSTVTPEILREIFFMVNFEKTPRKHLTSFLGAIEVARADISTRAKKLERISIDFGV